MPMMLRITAARAAPASLACESVCATSALRVRPQGCVLHSLAHGSAPSAARSRLMQCPLHSPARPHQPQARCGAPGRHAHYATAAAAATAPAVSPHVPIWAVAREQSSAAAAAEPPGRSASADDLGARAQPHSAEAEGPGRAPAEVPPRAEDSPTTITISPSTDSGRRKGGTQLAPRKAADLTTKKPPAAPPLVNDDGSDHSVAHRAREALAAILEACEQDRDFERSLDAYEQFLIKGASPRNNRGVHEALVRVALTTNQPPDILLDVLKLFQDPSVTAFNGVVDRCLQKQDYKSASVALHHWEVSRTLTRSPTAAYKTVVRMAMAQKDMAFLDSFLKRLERDSRVKFQRLAAYNEAILGLEDRGYKDARERAVELVNALLYTKTFNILTLNALVIVFGSRGDVDNMAGILQQLAERRIPIDDTMVKHAVSAMVMQGRRADMVPVVLELARASGAKLAPETYEHVVRKCASLGRELDCLSIVIRMYVYGPRPSLPVYNATLAALVDAQREDKAFRVLELMHQSHVQYDQETFDLVMGRMRSTYRLKCRDLLRSMRRAPTDTSNGKATAEDVAVLGGEEEEEEEEEAESLGLQNEPSVVQRSNRTKEAGKIGKTRKPMFKPLRVLDRTARNERGERFADSLRADFDSGRLVAKRAPVPLDKLVQLREEDGGEEETSDDASLGEEGDWGPRPRWSVAKEVEGLARLMRRLKRIGLIA